MTTNETPTSSESPRRFEKIAAILDSFWGEYLNGAFPYGSARNSWWADLLRLLSALATPDALARRKAA